MPQLQHSIRHRQWIRKLLGLGLFCLLGLNVLIYVHVYNFTHFTTQNVPKFDIDRAGFFEKLQVGLLGREVAKPTGELPEGWYRDTIIERGVYLTAFQKKTSTFPPTPPTTRFDLAFSIQPKSFSTPGSIARSAVAHLRRDQSC